MAKIQQTMEEIEKQATKEELEHHRATMQRMQEIIGEKKEKLEVTKRGKREALLTERPHPSKKVRRAQKEGEGGCGVAKGKPRKRSQKAKSRAPPNPTPTNHASNYTKSPEAPPPPPQDKAQAAKIEGLLSQVVGLFQQSGLGQSPSLHPGQGKEHSTNQPWSRSNFLEQGL